MSCESSLLQATTFFHDHLWRFGDGRLSRCTSHTLQTWEEQNEQRKKHLGQALNTNAHRCGQRYLWNTRTLRWGTRTRHTKLKCLMLTGCKSSFPHRTSSMYIVCTSLFMPIGRWTSALSGFGSAYVSISPWSHLKEPHKEHKEITGNQSTLFYPWMLGLTFPLCPPCLEVELR